MPKRVTPFELMLATRDPEMPAYRWIYGARQRLAGLLEVSNIEAGLQTVGWLGDGIDDETAAKAAAARQVEVIPVSWYDRGKPKRKGLQLGFAACTPNEIRRGVRDLAIALEDVRKRL
jgi:GntR family transcriptional regulator / MocR family aminotransferase